MGTSAEQFALMGGVFLLLGGAFVFAPQIVSVVNGFMATVFRRGRKEPEAARSAAPHEAPRGPVVHALERPEAPPAAPESDDSMWAPPGHDDEDGRSSDVVSRLRNEISSSWGRTGDR
jgi:hypothetical protein